MGQMVRELDGTRPVTNAVNALTALAPPKELALSTWQARAAKEREKKKKDRTPRGSALMNVMVTLFPRLLRFVSAGTVRRNLADVMEAEDVLGLNYGTGVLGQLCEKQGDLLVVNTETFPREIGKNWSVQSGEGTSRVEVPEIPVEAIIVAMQVWRDSDIIRHGSPGTPTGYIHTHS